MTSDPLEQAVGDGETRRFMDAIDAYTWGQDWLNGVASADASHPSQNIRSLSFDEEDGGVRVYSYHDRPRAMFVVIRDAANYSVCTRLLSAVAALPPSRPAGVEDAQALYAALEIVALARELVTTGLVNRGVDRGLVVVEKADKSDPHYRLCAALERFAAPPMAEGGER